MSFPWKTEVVWQADRPNQDDYNNDIMPAIDDAIAQGKTDGTITNTPNLDGTSTSVRNWATEADAQAWVVQITGMSPVSAVVIAPV